MNTNAPSTYLFQWEMLYVTVGVILVSNSTIKIPASTDPKGEPVATPSFVGICHQQNNSGHF